MEPITLVVTALASGATAALKPAAEQMVMDAYAGFKELIRRKYAQVDLTPLENKPESETKRASVAEDLVDAGADGDQELLEQAQALVELIRERAPDAGPAIGVDLDGVKAEFLKVRSVMSEGTGVKVRDAEFRGGIDLGEVRAGRTDQPNP